MTPKAAPSSLRAQLLETAQDDLRAMKREVSMRRDQFVDVHDLEKWAVLMEDAAAALAGPQWQPIETAPKDGSVVLVWVTSDPEVARWDAGRWETSDTCALPIQPTHWMPLPQAPDPPPEAP